MAAMRNDETGLPVSLPQRGIQMIVKIRTDMPERYRIEVTRKVGDEVIGQVAYADKNPKALHEQVSLMTQTLFDAVQITRPQRVVADKATTGGA